MDPQNAAECSIILRTRQNVLLSSERGGMFYYPQNAAECSIDLNGPSHRLEVQYVFILATDFLLLINIIYMILQGVRSLPLTEICCN